jgi:hypothetical protein
MRRFVTLASSALVGAALVLGGCGGSDEDSSSPSAAASASVKPSGCENSSADRLEIELNSGHQLEIPPQEFVTDQPTLSLCLTATLQADRNKNTFNTYPMLLVFSADRTDYTQAMALEGLKLELLSEEDKLYGGHAELELPLGTYTLVWGKQALPGVIKVVSRQSAPQATPTS